MNTLRVEDAEAVTLPIVSQCTRLLNAISQGCRAESYLRLVVGAGSAAQELRLPVGTLGSDLLPAAVLKELSYEVPPDMRLAACTFIDGEPADLVAFFVELTHPPVYDDATRTVTVAPARLAEVSSQIAGSSVAPSSIIDAGAATDAIWLLRDVLRLDDPEQRAHIERVQRDLAMWLGGRVDDAPVEVIRRSRLTHEQQPQAYLTMAAYDVRRPALRLPGSCVHGYGEPMPVRLVAADFTRRHALDAIDAAVRDATPKKKR